ncbi:MAG: plasmid mobilization relaxosome protein MobC [Lachnospiraceae bacterium]|nr:plasmid mobilization relaxosome protein MobC [Lachnospiraceae bacterium]MBQ1173542.1 plasmid mobilization relaxosome protein MobC [Lachnospiraceae bacterium]
MANRTRTHRNEVYLDDKEQFILEAKFKESKMKSKSAFLRKLILFGFVYDVDYSYLRNYNTELGRISKSLNQIAKRINSTNHIYQEDIDEVKELMNQVWHTQKSMLSKQPLIKR